MSHERKDGTPRIVVVQPAVPSYRVDFFERLSKAYGDAFAVHASPLDLGVLSEDAEVHRWLLQLPPEKPLGVGASWQPDAMRVPLAPGDVLVVSGAPRCLSNLGLLLRARWKRANVIWWGHYWSSTSRQWRQSLRLLLMGLAHGVLFYTDREVDEYCRRSKRVERRPIGALNNGIDVTPIRSLRQPYVARERGNEILFIGRLTDKARLGLLLDAIAAPELESAHLHVIGQGENRMQLRGRSKDLGFADRVTWHDATKDERKIAEVANRCRVFVYPGEVGLSLVHAMAYGLPAVIHSDRPRHMPEADAFDAGVTGEDFSLGDAGSLAVTLAGLLADTGKLNAYSAEALRRLEQDYSTESMAARFTRFLAANFDVSPAS